MIFSIIDELLVQDWSSCCSIQYQEQIVFYQIIGLLDEKGVDGSIIKKEWREEVDSIPCWINLC